jgi:hypothetical protein
LVERGRPIVVLKELRSNAIMAERRLVENAVERLEAHAALDSNRLFKAASLRRPIARRGGFGVADPAPWSCAEGSSRRTPIGLHRKNKSSSMT